MSILKLARLEVRKLEHGRPRIPNRAQSDAADATAAVASAHCRARDRAASWQLDLREPLAGSSKPVDQVPVHLRAWVVAAVGHHEPGPVESDLRKSLRQWPSNIHVPIFGRLCLLQPYQRSATMGVTIKPWLTCPSLRNEGTSCSRHEPQSLSAPCLLAFSSSRALTSAGLGSVAAGGTIPGLQENDIRLLVVIITIIIAVRMTRRRRLRIMIVLFV